MYVYTARYGMGGGGGGGIVYAHIPKEVWNFKTSHINRIISHILKAVAL